MSTPWRLQNANVSVGTVAAIAGAAAAVVAGDAAAIPVALTGATGMMFSVGSSAAGVLIALIAAVPAMAAGTVASGRCRAPAPRHQQWDRRTWRDPRWAAAAVGARWAAGSP